MKGATALRVHRQTELVKQVFGNVGDGQAYIDLVLSDDLPAYRAWFPFSPKTDADVAVMMLSTPFEIDVVSVECSGEEAHGVEARRLFLKNPRPIKE